MHGQIPPKAQLSPALPSCAGMPQGWKSNPKSSFEIGGGICLCQTFSGFSYIKSVLCRGEGEKGCRHHWATKPCSVLKCRENYTVFCISLGAWGFVCMFFKNNNNIPEKYSCRGMRSFGRQESNLLYGTPADFACLPFPGSLIRVFTHGLVHMGSTPCSQN